MNAGTQNRLSIIAPQAFLFALLAILILLLKPQLSNWGADIRVLHAANVLLFLVGSIAAMWMAVSLRRAGGQALLKALYGGFMIRFFLLAVTAFVYIMLTRKQVNLPGLIGGAIFYVLYVVVEIRSLRSVLKSGSPNA